MSLLAFRKHQGWWQALESKLRGELINRGLEKMLWAQKRKERYEGICSGGLEGLSARVPMSPEGKVEGTMKGGFLWTQHTPSLQTTSLFEVGLVYFSFKGEHEHRAILPKWA